MTWWKMYTSGAGGANSVLQLVANYKDSYGGPLRLGGYAWNAPHTNTDYTSQTYCDLDYRLNIIKDIFFDIEDTRIVDVFSARTLNTGTPLYMRRRNDERLYYPPWIVTLLVFLCVHSLFSFKVQTTASPVKVPTAGTRSLRTSPGRLTTSGSRPCRLT